jgi:hypothetical protein
MTTNNILNHLEVFKTRLIAGELVFIEIMSDSMSPVLKVGESYLVSKIERDYKPKKFEILIYWNGEKLIAHYFNEIARLAETNEDVWIFKSIKSKNKEDFPVRPESIVGIVNKKISVYFRLIIQIRNILN